MTHNPEKKLGVGERGWGRERGREMMMEMEREDVIKLVDEGGLGLEVKQPIAHRLRNL